MQQIYWRTLVPKCHFKKVVISISDCNFNFNKIVILIMFESFQSINTITRWVSKSDLEILLRLA